MKTKTQFSPAQVVGAMIEAHIYAWALAQDSLIADENIVQAIYIARLAWLLS